MRQHDHFFSFTWIILIPSLFLFSLPVHADEGQEALKNISYSVSHADEALALEPEEVWLISRHVQDSVSHAKDAIKLMPKDKLNGKLAITHLKDALRHLELAIPQGDQRHTAHGRESLKFAEKATVKLVN